MCLVWLIAWLPSFHDSHPLSILQLSVSRWRNLMTTCQIYLTSANITIVIPCISLINQLSMLRLFRVFHISCFLCVPLFRMLMYFFTFCVFSRVVCKFRCVYICAIPSCSFSVSLSSGTLSSWFSEPRCKHFGIYLPAMESEINCWTNWISFKLCLKSTLCLFCPLFSPFLSTQQLANYFFFATSLCLSLYQHSCIRRLHRAVPQKRRFLRR